MRLILTFGFMLGLFNAQGQNHQNLVGCWTMPGLKGENLSLDSERNFFFNDYQEISRSFEPIFGGWKVKHDILILTYGEQKEIRFKIKVTETGALMLTRPGRVQLFKAKREDCESQ